MKSMVSLLLGASLSVMSIAAAISPAPLLAHVHSPDSFFSLQNTMATPTVIDQLVGTQWLLEDLAGTGVIDNAQTTLVFLSPTSIAGQGGCNYYHASIQSEGDAITVGAIASTRKMCVAASLMNQESRYLQALQAANRMALGENGLLYIYVDGNETPLRFSRMHGRQA